MKTPDELHAVDWASLHHGLRAEATDVPRRILALYSDDGERADQAVRGLWVLTRWAEAYPATVAAIPFLAHAAVHVPRHRARLIRALVSMADLGGAEEDRTACRALVMAEVPALLPFQDDEDPAVRREVLTLLTLTRTTGEDPWADLVRRYEQDPDGQLRADALTTLAGLAEQGADGGDRAAAVRRWAAEARTDPEPPVREAAAVLLMEEAGAPYPDRLVALLAEAGTHARRSGWDRSFLVGLPDPGPRLGRVLDADPRAAATVARQWIAAADRDRRGSALAARLTARWRDREDEAVDLLREAVPYRQASTFRHLEELLPFTRRPAHRGLAAVLLPLAADERKGSTRDPRLLLGLLGDERLTRFVTEPDIEDDADALGALAASTGRLDLWRAVLRSPYLTEDNRALTRLSPAVTSELLPELTHLLLRRRHVTDVARAIGDAGTADAETIAALTATAHEEDGYEPPADEHHTWDVLARRHSGEARTGNAVAAAVALARVGGTADRALTLLSTSPDPPSHLDLVGLLGPAARPLLPRVEAALESPWPAPRLSAARAHHRITGDAYARCVPALLDLVRERLTGDDCGAPSPTALAALAELGVTPHEIRPHLRTWADSERRILSCSTGSRRDDRLREAARAHLRLGGEA
ncbi:hypothetical protein ACIRBY_03715 [Streptomyces sp. NPDC096136]|uniref:hypothetical protein n=1 Tax=Streptomyces sp. NPDC096136 TaxID=3366076 RepID=UPI0037F5AD5E